MIFRKKQAFDQAGLSPVPVVTTVLKDAFTAVSAVVAEKVNLEAGFKYLHNYRLICDNMNGASAIFSISIKKLLQIPGGGL